ncbi:hypothetical protein BC830DRAFT_1072804, partial [Chytriomyces sp. MP71]
FGVCLAHGWGVEKNDSKAVQLFRAAAEQGFPNAEYNMGVRYSTGHGVPHDDHQAFQWFERAAKQGHAKAQSNLGVCFVNGKGCEKDDAIAIEWYTLAAKNKDPVALFNLGEIYETGDKGVDRDLDAAVEFYKSASFQGVERADERLEALGVAIPIKGAAQH